MLCTKEQKKIGSLCCNRNLRWVTEFLYFCYGDCGIDFDTSYFQFSLCFSNVQSFLLRTRLWLSFQNKVLQTTMGSKWGSEEVSLLSKIWVAPWWWEKFKAWIIDSEEALGACASNSSQLEIPSRFRCSCLVLNAQWSSWWIIYHIFLWRELPWSTIFLISIITFHLTWPFVHLLSYGLSSRCSGARWWAWSLT